MKPRQNYRLRPKKTGARKRQKILAQIRRLILAGYEKERLEKMNIVEIRELLKEAARGKKPSLQETQLGITPSAEPTVKPELIVKAKAPAKKKPKAKSAAAKRPKRKQEKT